MFSILFSNNSMLDYLNCHFNQLTSLDLSSLNELTELTCNDNQLTELSIKNGNNTNVSTFYSLNNPNLSCIEVDDPALSTNSNNWSKDGTSSYSNDCNVSVTKIPTLEQLTTVFPNPTSGKINLETSQDFSYNIEVQNLLGQFVLTIPTSRQRMQRIDLSTFPKGTYLIHIQNATERITKKIVLN